MEMNRQVGKFPFIAPISMYTVPHLCIIQTIYLQKYLMVLREQLLSRTQEKLVEALISGVAYSQDELGTSPPAQTLLNIDNFNDEFIVPSLPNLLFTRDGFSVMEQNVFIWQMAKQARHNEPLIFRVCV